MKYIKGALMATLFLVVAITILLFPLGVIWLIGIEILAVNIVSLIIGFILMTALVLWYAENVEIS